MTTDESKPANSHPSEESSGAERRTSPRVLVDLEVDYRCEDTFLFAYITDMSAMGIFVRTNNPEPRGTELQLRFIPPGEAAPLTVEGRVAWLNPFRPGDVDHIHPGMGVELMIDEPTKQRLIDLVRKIAYIEKTD